MAVPGPQALTLIAVGLLGFASAPLYPAMMHAVPERFNHATAASVIGYQSGAAMVGVMTIPPAFGFIAAHTTFNLLPYLVILLTGLIFLAQIKVDGLWLRK
jgi:MFS family permease